MKLIKSSIFDFSILLGVSAILSACGAAGSRTITVDAGFAVRSHAPYNMSEKITHLLNATPPTCVQRQVYLILHDHTIDQMVSATQVALETSTTACALPAYDNVAADLDILVNYLANPACASVDAPLSVTVPNDGHQYEVGIVGSIFQPQDSLTETLPFNVSSGGDGNCDQLSGLPDPFTQPTPPALPSSNIFGHALVDSTSTTATLDIEVLHATPMSSPYDGSYGGANITSIPGKEDWVQLDPLFTTTYGSARLKRIAYLDGATNVSVDSTGGSNIARYYAPHLFPYNLVFDYNGNNSGAANTGCVGGSTSTTCNGKYTATVNGALSALPVLNLIPGTGLVTDQYPGIYTDGSIFITGPIQFTTLTTATGATVSLPGANVTGNCTAVAVPITIVLNAHVTIGGTCTGIGQVRAQGTGLNAYPTQTHTMIVTSPNEPTTGAPLTITPSGTYNVTTY